MTLFCHRCGKIHAFTQQDAERLVYCLQAQYCDQVMDQGRARTDYMTEHFDCLKDVLGWTYDQEMYAEYVQSDVEVRRSQRKEVREAMHPWREQVFCFAGIEVWYEVSRHGYSYEVWTSDDQEKHGTWDTLAEALAHGERIRTSGYLEALES